MDSTGSHTHCWLQRERQQLLRGRLPDTVQPSLHSPPTPLDAVPRRDCKSLSRKEFMREYATKGRPVIITGLLSSVLCGEDWTWAGLHATIGSRQVQLKKFHPVRTASTSATDLNS